MKQERKESEHSTEEVSILNQFYKIPVAEYDNFFALKIKEKTIAKFGNRINADLCLDSIKLILKLNNGISGHDPIGELEQTKDIIDAFILKYKGE